MSGEGIEKFELRKQTQVKSAVPGEQPGSLMQRVCPDQKISPRTHQLSSLLVSAILHEKLMIVLIFKML